MIPTKRSVRDILLGLGIGDFNATIMIQPLWTAPATTDPKSPAIIMLVAGIQRTLNKLGAGLSVSGYLDQPTARALAHLNGSGWEQKAWVVNAEGVLDALEGGHVLRGDGTMFGGPSARPPLADIYTPPFLPPIPGGIVTYAAGAYLAYRMFKKRR